MGRFSLWRREKGRSRAGSTKNGAMPKDRSVARKNPYVGRVLEKLGPIMQSKKARIWILWGLLEKWDGGGCQILKGCTSPAIGPFRGKKTGRFTDQKK